MHEEKHGIVVGEGLVVHEGKHRIVVGSRLVEEGGIVVGGFDRSRREHPHVAPEGTKVSWWVEG